MENGANKFENSFDVLQKQKAASKGKIGEVILEMEHISKTFPGVKALQDVSFELKRGEVHVLLGENGAGKSTLMKILGGSYQADIGEILIDKNKVNYKNPIGALNAGVAMIYQELNPVPHMSIGENIFLGKEQRKAGGIVDYKKMYEETSRLLKIFDMNLDPKRLMVNLSVAETQMIEIIKAYSFDANILIMDEPTSAISDHEVDSLFKVINMIKNEGVGIVYISHKMDEIFRIGDRITVLRDGEYVATKNIEDVDISEVIKMMVGRDISEQFPKETVPIGDVILKVENLCSDAFKDVSFELKRGEILGIAGLMGAGRTEVVEAIFGIRKITGGKIYIGGKQVEIRNPSDAIKNKLALVSEDRKKVGLNLKDTVRFNISICVLRLLSKLGVVNNAIEKTEVNKYIEKLNVKTPSPEQIVNFLSGGNQQKVVIAKWLMTDPDIIILDEPTRGIDVGAKSEIHSIMSALAAQNKAIIMISSELPEVMGMSDRVLVLHEGRLTGEINRGELSQEAIMGLATGGNNEN